MSDLSKYAELVGRDKGQAIVSTTRADGSVQCSLVNSGVLDHPVTGEPVVGYVAIGGSRKLANLRVRPQTTIAVHVGWEWFAVEGRAQLIGPDDPCPGVDAERLRLFLREVFSACGGTHDHWDAYDAAMLAERRTAVLIAPERAYPSSGRR